MFEDVIGRVRKTRLAADDCLMPLFEALVNAFDAISERNGSTSNKTSGRIEIAIHREPFFENKDKDAPRSINGFTVSDNGIGFNDKNFEFFNHGDSTYKFEKGGKGIGRFLWLKAFEEIEVDSVFEKEDKRHRRTFKFALTKEGVSDSKVDECEGAPDQITLVTLKDFKNP